MEVYSSFSERLLKGRDWGQKGNQREMIGPAGQSRGETGAKRAIKGRYWGQKGKQGERLWPEGQQSKHACAWFLA